MNDTVVVCPSCGEDVVLVDGVELSEVIVCESCDRELEIVSLDPPGLEEWEEEEK